MVSESGECVRYTLKPDLRNFVRGISSPLKRILQVGL